MREVRPWQGEAAGDSHPHSCAPESPGGQASVLTSGRELCLVVVVRTVDLLTVSCGWFFNEEHEKEGDIFLHYAYGYLDTYEKCSLTMA